MTEIVYRNKTKEETIEADNIKGQKVLDVKGNEIGKIKSLHVDPVSLSVEAITIDNGLFKGSDYVGKNYIFSLTDKAAVLSVTPITQLIGLTVYDSEGKELGRVKEVYRVHKTNSILSLIVDRGIMKSDLIVYDDEIKELGKNIILNESFKEPKEE